MSKKKAFYQEGLILEDRTTNDVDDMDSAMRKSPATTKLNLPRGWTRTTVTIREDHLQKLKDLAWWGRSSQGGVLEEILEKFFATHEVRPIPKKNKILDDE